MKGSLQMKQVEKKRAVRRQDARVLSVLVSVMESTFEKEVNVP